MVFYAVLLSVLVSLAYVNNCHGDKPEEILVPGGKPLRPQFRNSSHSGNLRLSSACVDSSYLSCPRGYGWPNSNTWQCCGSLSQYFCSESHPQCTQSPSMPACCGRNYPVLCELGQEQWCCPDSAPICSTYEVGCYTGQCSCDAYTPTECYHLDCGATCSSCCGKYSAYGIGQARCTSKTTYGRQGYASILATASCAVGSTPTNKPTGMPTPQPSHLPTREPTNVPTYKPTVKPTGKPSPQLTHTPTRRPSNIPTCQPIAKPTKKPKGVSICIPTLNPTATSSSEPTTSPTTNQPTNEPTDITAEPSRSPTWLPTAQISGSADEGDNSALGEQSDPTLGTPPAPSSTSSHQSNKMSELELSFLVIGGISSIFGILSFFWKCWKWVHKTVTAPDDLSTLTVI